MARCHKSGYIIGQRKAGEPPTAASISVAFTRLARALKLSGISHHVLRHTGASVLVQAGVSPGAVRQ